MSLYAKIKRKILINGIIKTSKIKLRYDYNIPRTSPIESKFGDLKLKYEKIKISIIPSIIILNIK